MQQKEFRRRIAELNKSIGPLALKEAAGALTGDEEAELRKLRASVRRIGLWARRVRRSPLPEQVQAGRRVTPPRVTSVVSGGAPGLGKRS